MALKLRKDIKKSSYYVWFLGAKESKGLRGEDYVLPVIQHLVEREKDIEPFKVTLQVSHKGLKIVQNIVASNSKSAKPKNEVIKHFIPHNTITCVYQSEDIVACILLLFNPVTKCPLHVHAYRCDSLETAGLLKTQLQALIERPENQKKFAEIESRLKAPKEKKKFDSSLGSDTGTSTTRESESSEERFGGIGPDSSSGRVATLYDSVAAELRQKLGKNDVPILLPPRDYDTVHRQKGNLTGIELRRCLNANIVGQNVKNGRRIESSGGSSGIGSDHAPSPDSPDAPETRYNAMDNQSTSDEDWSADPEESTLYLMHGPPDVHPTLQRQGSRSIEPVPDSLKSDYRIEQRFSRYEEQKPKYHRENSIEKYNAKPKKAEQPPPHHKYIQEPPVGGRESKSKEDQPRYRPTSRYHDDERFENEQWERDYLDGSGYKTEKSSKYPEKAKVAQRYSQDDGFDENIKYRSNKYYQDENVRYYNENTKPRSKGFSAEDPRYYSEETSRSNSRTEKRYYEVETPPSKPVEKPRQKCIPDDPRYYDPEPKIHPRKTSDRDSKPSDKSSRSKYSQEDYYEEHHSPVGTRRRPETRQRSPSPEPNVSPRDRFKDAKEKFLLLEQERLRNQEVPVSPTKDKSFLKRHESMMYTKPKYDRYDSEPKDRYFDERRFENERETYKPKPAPRSMPVNEEVRYRREVPLERYRSPDRYDPKRRSMFNLIEEEHRKNSNEIAKELKRRSYMENNNFEDEFYRSDKKSYELQDHERYPGLDRDNYHYSKSSVELDKVGEMKFEQKYMKNQPPPQKTKNSAGYRHSYAEPKLRMEKGNKKMYPEMLHRTNSSVSNSGRVGIASVHPY